VVTLPSGYIWQEGRRQDAHRLQHWLAATLQESFPEQHSWSHLQATVEQLYDPPTTPCWWIRWQADGSFVGCGWAGISRDQVTHDRIAYIFLIRVDPAHRRQGLGRSLLQAIMAWAKSQDLRGLSLQVFSHNEPALRFYQQLGFHLQGYWMGKSLGSTDT
jgi:ribosomal protein S18 acetylase RimI-like enzyme